MRNPLYVGEFANANYLGSYINQKSVTQDFYKQNPYEYRLDAYYEKLNVEKSSLNEIYHLVHKQFLSIIDHLDYHPSINTIKCPLTQSLVGTKTDTAETLCKNVTLTVSPTLLKDSMMK